MIKARATNKTKKSKQKRRTKKIKFFIYIQSNGDGSASPIFFATEKLAEAVAAEDDERFCDDVSPHEFVVDLDTGEVISGIIISSPTKD